MFHMIFSKPVPAITPNEAKSLLAKDGRVFLLDVRSDREYMERRISGSINLPLDRIRHMESIVPDKESMIIVYCLSGARAAKAGSQLLKMGYTHVFNMGGITGWPYETISGKE